MDDLVETSLKKSLENDYKVGAIVQIDAGSNILGDQLLSTGSDLNFKFLNADPASDNYKWTIKRGFTSIKTNESTSTDTYRAKLSQSGAYDFFAHSYESEEIKTSASKRFVAGSSCSLNDILEIELSSASASSFIVGGSGSATFILRDSENFSSIQWKATLPSGKVITNEEEEEDTDTFKIDLSSESAGTLVIEVSATSADVLKSECLNYRRKELVVASNANPYFNLLSFTNGTDEVLLTLENNDIYKYERPNTNRFVKIEVFNADTCQYQVNNGNKVGFSCDEKLIKIPLDSSTSCVNGAITLFASDSSGQSEPHSQEYYYYCGENEGYCYFGLASARQSSHSCSIDSVELASTKSPMEFDPKTPTSTLRACPSGQYNSEVACDNVNPSHSSCQADSNGCYAWSCDDGYYNAGSSCLSCPTSSVCNANNPSNSSCQVDGNGCYAWSCNSGYQRIGNTCEGCPTSSVCDTNKPSNSSCQADGNGCYAWSCNSGYQRIGNTCEGCPTSSACDTNKPSNSSCQADGNGCYAWSCNSGYHLSGNACVSCPTSSTCNASNPSNSSCQADSNGCYTWSCNSGYHLSGNACVSCPASGTCSTNKPSNSSCQADSNGCYAWSCNSGYRRSGNSCESCPTSSTCNANNPSNSSCQADGNGCYAWSCNSSYRRSGNSCVSCPTSSTCNANNPSNSSCQADGNGCYTWSCSNGYHLSGNTCVSCPTSSTCNANNPSNSSCQADGNGCYAWSCNSGYRRSGSACVSCPTSSTCNASNPSNSSCQADGNGCYAWSCNSGYRRSGSACVSCPTSSTCNASNPSNSSCQADGNGCYAWSCNSGYRRSGNSCVSCPTSSTCNASNPSNSRCRADSNRCYAWSCNSGYRRSGNSCVSCPTSSTCNASNPSNSSCQADSNKCYAWSCNSGYRRSGNSCVSCPTSSTCNASNPSNSSCQADSNGCYAWSCNSGYRRSGNSCVSCPTSNACNANNPSNSSCQADGNGCYSWSCNSGYRRSGNSCVSCPTSSACNDNKPRNSSCQADGNGCYAWSCNNGYDKINNRCVRCTKDNEILDSNGQCICRAGYQRKNSTGPCLPACSDLCSQAQARGTQGTCGSTTANWDHCGSANTVNYTIVDLGDAYNANQCCLRQSKVPLCNNTQKCSCSRGSISRGFNSCLNDTDGVADTAGYWKWKCEFGGQTSGDCFKAKPPACNNNVRCSCNLGTPLTGSSNCQADTDGVADTTGFWRWRCEFGGHKTGVCQKAKPRENGVCNHSRPYSRNNLCSSGTQSSIDTSQWPWRWTCSGKNNGTNAQCTFNCPNSYPFEDTCNNAKPNNSVPCFQVASGQTAAGCYTWSCKTGYRYNGTTRTCDSISTPTTRPPTTTTRPPTTTTRPPTPTTRPPTPQPPTATTQPPATVICGDCGSYRGDSDASCDSGSFYLHPGHNNLSYGWTCRNDPHTEASRSSCNGKREDSCDACRYSNRRECEAVAGHDSCERSGDCWEKGPAISGICGSNCGACSRGSQNSATGACWLSGGQTTRYDCSWDCDGVNGGVSDGCTVTATNSPCFDTGPTTTTPPPPPSTGTGGGGGGGGGGCNDPSDPECGGGG